MTGNDQTADSDPMRDGDDRLAAVGDRIDEARQAADDAAAVGNVSDEERRSARESEIGADSGADPGSPADDVIGHPSGEGSEVSPG